jgi:hypothetical protein
LLLSVELRVAFLFIGSNFPPLPLQITHLRHPIICNKKEFQIFRLLMTNSKRVSVKRYQTLILVIVFLGGGKVCDWLAQKFMTNKCLVMVKIYKPILLLCYLKGFLCIISDSVLHNFLNNKISQILISTKIPKIYFNFASFHLRFFSLF